RQANASRQARQKLGAQLRLELLDVPGQCGLGDADLVCGAGDASFIRDLHEVLDAAQFHELEPFPSRDGDEMTQRSQNGMYGRGACFLPLGEASGKCPRSVSMHAETACLA